MKTFINSQFGYCPLVWMFHSRTRNNRINKIHEGALRIVYNDINTFDELLKRDGSVTVHERNIQALAIELYKTCNGISPDILHEIFQLNESSIYCSKYGTETLSFRGPKIWDLITNEIKQAKSLKEFKNNIKNVKTTKCPCRMCKTIVAMVGFVNVAT